MRGNSMGLILDARSLHFFGSIAYSKAEKPVDGQDAHSKSSLMGRHCSDSRCGISEALSKGLDSSTFI
jgi:hypothetical protein